MMSLVSTELFISFLIRLASSVNSFSDSSFELKFLGDLTVTLVELSAERPSVELIIGIGESDKFKFVLLIYLL